VLGVLKEYVREGWRWCLAPHRGCFEGRKRLRLNLELDKCKPLGQGAA
jgi:hypothetical protein